MDCTTREEVLLVAFDSQLRMIHTMECVLEQIDSLLHDGFVVPMLWPSRGQSSPRVSLSRLPIEV